MLENEIIQALKNIWDYMKIDMKIEKSDIIIGCGCLNLDIPVKCSELLKENYADKIIFTGGLGKLTDKVFKETEAEIFKKIAMENGIEENKIYLENKSTNTGDNFRFSLKLIKKNNIKAEKIIIVHNNLSQRRTLNTAKAILKNKKIFITSPYKTFEQFINSLYNKTDENVHDIISVIVGDIQRIIIFPQLGWQVEDIVPENIINSYYLLKNKGYNKFIFKKEQIQELIYTYGIQEGMKPNYFN